MILYEDTRQKKDKHKNIKKQCLNLKITLIPKKLDIGDYKVEGVENIVIDTKKDVYELTCDFFSKKELVRFQRECKRAKKNRTTLYILVEENLNKAQLLNWKSKNRIDGQPITKATGEQVYDRMQIYSLAFGVKWRFCDKKTTVETMLKLFGVKND